MDLLPPEPPVRTGPSVAGRHPGLAELPGVWRRSLRAWPDGRQDTATSVLWVQGPRLYVDLRQAPGPPYGPEGFAGELVVEGGLTEWRRGLDLNPPGPYRDRGWLTYPAGGHPDLLVEDGHDMPYVEHWHRLPGSTGISAALRLAGPHGAEGVLVRAGSFFGYAHGTPGRPGPTCQEVSLGRIRHGRWAVERSSRPERAGELFDPALPGHRGRWEVTAVEGDPDAFPPPFSSVPV